VVDILITYKAAIFSDVWLRNMKSGTVLNDHGRTYKFYVNRFLYKDVKFGVMRNFENMLKQRLT
jgi:hypothetical protein